MLLSRKRVFQHADSKSYKYATTLAGEGIFALNTEIFSTPLTR